MERGTDKAAFEMWVSLCSGGAAAPHALKECIHPNRGQGPGHLGGFLLLFLSFLKKMCEKISWLLSNKLWDFL